jgi:rare lipoprotein A
MRNVVTAAVLLLVLTGAACAGQCRASWYGGGEYLNRHTANGERFNPRALTAAHRSLPFGTRIRVTYRGKSVVVRINDRGPARYTGRCLDLSRAAADAIGMRRAGVGNVTYRVMGR